MYEGTMPGAVSDGYIAARKAELTQTMTAAPGADGALADVFKLLGAILHYEAAAKLEALKTLYDPLDPDAPEGRRDTNPAAFEAFERALVETLERANFTEIDHDTVQ